MISAGLFGIRAADEALNRPTGWLAVAVKRRLFGLQLGQGQVPAARPSNRSCLPSASCLTLLIEAAYWLIISKKRTFESHNS